MCPVRLCLVTFLTITLTNYNHQSKPSSGTHADPNHILKPVRNPNPTLTTLDAPDQTVAMPNYVSDAGDAGNAGG